MIWYKIYIFQRSNQNNQTLEKRREILCLRFAKKCLENEKLKDFFQKSKNVLKMKKLKFFPKKRTNSSNKETNSEKVQTE